MSRTRGYCFTINNYTDEELEFCYCCLKDSFEFVIVGEEVGEEGTPHLQGYIYDSSRPTFNKVKKLLPRAHIENAKGSPQQNITYCSKEGDWVEYGDRPSQGKRNDFEEIKEMLDSGESLLDVAGSHFSTFIRYNKGIMLYMMLLLKPRTIENPPKIMWLYGDTGVGKTRFAYDTYKSVYMKDGTKWWNGYTQQQCIVIDDYDGKWPFRDLLKLLDIYPYAGQFKGGYVEINSPVIIVTCDRSIDEVNDHLSPKEMKQLKRRFSIIRKLE